MIIGDVHAESCLWVKQWSFIPGKLATYSWTKEKVNKEQTIAS